MAFSETARRDVRKICDVILERLETKHIGCFEGMSTPLFLISEAYPGVWLEHLYDSVFYAQMFPSGLTLAENTVELFMRHQKENGQLPCYVMNAAKTKSKDTVGYSQIQECVSFAGLCLRVFEMRRDYEKLKVYYEAAKAWEGWLRLHRMTTGCGLVEMFVGYDTGHDNSGRLRGLTCEGRYEADEVVYSAETLPPNDPVAPILAVDMNANFYGTQRALAKMARHLGLTDEAEQWERQAREVKERLFSLCYDKEDAFFYDVDKNGNKRKYLSSTIFHLFMEGVLDRERDCELIAEIYERHIKNPREFWTAYPFPSMAVSDASCLDHVGKNCWGYYSQGLIALRCTLWMDAYGMSGDFDYICEKWVQAWTACYEEMKLGQELDPMDGTPTQSSEWYSSCMLFYLYAAKRLHIL